MRSEDHLTYKLGEIIKASTDVRKSEQEGSPVHIVTEYEQLLRCVQLYDPLLFPPERYLVSRSHVHGVCRRQDTTLFRPRCLPRFLWSRLAEVPVLSRAMRIKSRAWPRQGSGNRGPLFPSLSLRAFLSFFFSLALDSTTDKPTRSTFRRLVTGAPCAFLFFASASAPDRFVST